MSIFEDLENLNVSEECFDDIMSLVEELLSEDIHSAIDTYAKTDKKGRDALHKKARINKDNAEYEDDERRTNRLPNPLHPDPEKEHEESLSNKYSQSHPLDRIDNRALRRSAKKRGIDVDKKSPEGVLEPTGLRYRAIQKEAGQLGKKTKNEKGEEYTKNRSEGAKERIEDKEKALRNVGDMYIRYNGTPTKKFDKDQKAVNDYMNSRKEPKKSAEDKSTDRYYKKHPIEYDYED